MCIIKIDICFKIYSAETTLLVLCTELSQFDDGFHFDVFVQLERAKLEFEKEKRDADRDFHVSV